LGQSCPRTSSLLQPASTGASRTSPRPGGARGVHGFRGSFGVHAIKAGRYLISARLEKESGYGIGLFERTVDLAEGANGESVSQGRRKVPILMSIIAFILEVSDIGCIGDVAGF
jgi:hypothetical protein